VVTDYVSNPVLGRRLRWIMIIGWLVLMVIGAVAVFGGAQM